MKKLLTLALLLLTGSVHAQDATLTQVCGDRGESKYVLVGYDVTVSTAHARVSVRDAAGVEVRVAAYTIPDAAHPTADVSSFVTAIGTPRTGETGGALRRMAFRVVGYLVDKGYIAGVVVNP